MRTISNCLTIAFAGIAALPAVAADFGSDVKPILARACIGCHGPEKQRGGLRLDTPAGVRAGGESGPILAAGDAAKSRLVHAVEGTNDVAVMPPKSPRLTADEIGKIKAWIAAGADLPGEQAEGTKENHWAFQPVKRPVVPTDRAGDPIAAFVQARLAKDGFKLSPEAERGTLLRRLALDLTGLPPTAEECDAFRGDTRPDAYDRQVERLLASPHYGERWGRHWLDLARYADTNGYSVDAPRTIWPYRDWVINALNRDMPFDRFSIEQLAGDLLPNATTEQKIATGFHRNTQINEEGGIDPEQFRIEAVVDRTNTTGSVWLGLTVGCAQCHNHKFDPISQKEYFQLFAYFNSQDEPLLPLGPLPGVAVLPKVDVKGKKSDPPKLTTMVLKERDQPRNTFVLKGGDFTRPGQPVTPGTPAVLPPLPANAKPTRLDLARWLTAPENPLTARVAVNRVWGQYFGLGLVETENDFGTRGSAPTHPEVLDWLAAEFVASNWSQKALHRVIVRSAVYRQASQVRPASDVVDPRNRLLARQSRLRLEAEVVRDVSLVAAGLLDRTLGGPTVYPPQPDGVGQFTQMKREWKTNTDAARYRRGLYTNFRRSAPHPALTAFDAPDAGTACTRRNRSNTPLQALTLLNDGGFAEYAYGLALTVSADGSTPAEDVRAAVRRTLSRDPTTAETTRLSAFLTKQRDHFNAHAAEATALLAGGGPAGKRLADAPGDPARKAALVLLARVLLNLDETITRE